MTATLLSKATWGGRALAAAFAIAASGGAASAQSLDSGRAFRGLFAPNVMRTSAALTTDVYQGANRGATGAGSSGSVYDQGLFTGVSSNLAISHVGRRTSYGANAFGMVRYHPDLGTVRSLFHGGALGVRHEGRRIALQMEQQVSEQPAFEFGNLRGLGARALGSLRTVSSDRGVDGYGLLTSASNIGLGFQSRRRQWLTLGYRFAYSKISPEDETVPEVPLSTFRAQDISLRATHQFWKDTGLHLDASASRGGVYQLGAGPGTWIYNFNASLDRAQSFSITRTLSMHLGGGASVLKDVRGQRSVFVGGGGVAKRMGRSTRATLGARRDVQFVEGLADPVLNNGIFLDVEAQPSRRWHVGFRGIASRGRAALGSDGSTDVNFQSYGVDARVRVRVSGPLAAYGEYMNFHQQFDQTDALLVLGRPVDRDGFRVGLVITVPLFGQRGVE